MFHVKAYWNVISPVAKTASHEPRSEWTTLYRMWWWIIWLVSSDFMLEVSQSISMEGFLRSAVILALSLFESYSNWAYGCILHTKKNNTWKWSLLNWNSSPTVLRVLPRHKRDHARSTWVNMLCNWWYSTDRRCTLKSEEDLFGWFTFGVWCQRLL